MSKKTILLGFIATLSKRPLTIAILVFGAVVVWQGLEMTARNLDVRWQNGSLQVNLNWLTFQIGQPPAVSSSQ